MSFITLKLCFNDEIRRSTVDERSLVSLVFLSTRLKSIVPGVDLFGSVAVYWKDSEGDFITISSDEDVLEAVRCLPKETAVNGGRVLRLYGMQKKRSLDGDRSPRFEGGGRPPRHCHRGGWRSNVEFVPVMASNEPQKEPEDAAMNGEQQKKKEPQLHVGISCDGCNGQVLGYRYKCMGCADYDLCSACEDKHLHDQHPMIRIVDPSDNSWRRAFHASGFGAGRGGVGCPMMMRGSFAGSPSEAYMQQVIENVSIHAGNHAAAMAAAAAGAGNAAAQSGAAAGGNFLRSVGESVAAVLNGFGIDVDVDVEHNGKRQKVVTPRTTTVAEEQQQPPAPEHNNVVVESSTMMMDTNTARLSELHLMDQVLPIETQTAAVILPTADAADLHDDVTVTVDNEAGDRRGVEWTFVDCPTVAVTNPLPGALYPTMAPATASAPVIVQQVQHGDPVVRGALQQLLEMGFANEGGWLTALVESKHGDINAVLDALKPVSRH